MINWLHSRFFSPAKGWDPLSEGIATEYAQAEWGVGPDESLLGVLEEWLGGLKGKTVLDLGGGPGHYSVAFAKRGARVTWHDISERYRQFARTKAREAGADIIYSLGYMDDAPALLGQQFDLVFNRVCWNYGRGDASFARAIHSLVKPGGVGYVDTMHSGFRSESRPLHARLQVCLNNLVGWKVGHPFPPRGRVARLLMRLPIERVLVDYSGPVSDRVVFRKPASE